MSKRRQTLCRIQGPANASKFKSVHASENARLLHSYLSRSLLNLASTLRTHHDPPILCIDLFPCITIEDFNVPTDLLRALHPSCSQRVITRLKLGRRCCQLSADAARKREQDGRTLPTTECVCVSSENGFVARKMESFGPSRQQTLLHSSQPHSQ